MAQREGKEESKHDVVVKLIVIGDSGTGKSCLLRRFIDNRFTEDQTHTIGVEFGARIVELFDAVRVKLQVWDTAGQERYRSVTRSYYRGALGCLLVYDVTCRQSYEHVPQWLNAARTLAGPNVQIMLVGNKADEADAGGENADGTQKTRRVTHLEAAAFAQEHGLMMLETSAVTGEFVEESFLKVAKAIVTRMREEGAAGVAGAAGGAAGDNVQLTDAQRDAGGEKRYSNKKCCGGSSANTDAEL